jgi:cytoskeletal protein RodZ
LEPLVTDKKPATAAGVTLEDIGRLLKQERENASLTRTDVSSKTKISIDQLTRIEDGKFDHMATVYARGFLRSYCDAVGLDPAPILADFRKLSQGFDDNNILLLQHVPNKLVGEGRSHGWTVAGLAVLLLALLAAALYMSPSFRSSVIQALPETVRERLAPPAEAPAPSGPVIPAAAAGAGDALAAESIGLQPPPQVFSGRLTLRAEAPTWAQVTVDDQQVEHILFEAGQLRSFEGEKLITVACGDGRALRTEWNGQDMGPLGQNGPVERFFNLTPVGELSTNPS